MVSINGVEMPLEEMSGVLVLLLTSRSIILLIGGTRF